MSVSKKQLKRQKRHKRVRAKVSGSGTVPRLCVTRTNVHIYAQLIDDNKGHTLLTASDLEINPHTKRGHGAGSTKKSEASPHSGVGVKIKKGKKVDLASEVGKLIAKKAQEKKIEKVVFDRGGYKYHGRVKSLAEGAREGGLKF